MWTVIKVGSSLKFYDFKAGQYTAIGNLRYAEIDELTNINGVSFTHDGVSNQILDHDKCVSELLNFGIPLFIKKSDAAKAATSINLTGYKYFKLEPTKIQL